MKLERKILFLLYYYPPIKSISTRRNANIVKHFGVFFEKKYVFSTKNADVLPIETAEQDADIVAADKVFTLDYRTLTNLKKRKQIHYREETKENIRFLIKVLDSFPFNLFIGEGGFFYSFFSVLKAIKLIKKEKITHIYSSFRPMSDHFSAYILKIIFPKLVWIADYRDLHTDPIYKNVYLPRFQNACNQFLMKKANLITTVSEGLAKHLRYYDADKVHVLTSGIELTEKKDIALIKFLKFTIVYTGSMFRDERDPSLLCAVLEKLKEEGRITPDNFQILYAGKDTDIWQNWVKKYNISTFFTSKGMLPLSEAVALQYSAHINLLLTTATPELSGFLSGKFFEYLSARRPIAVLIKGTQDMEFEAFKKDLNFGFVGYNDTSFADLKTFLEEKITEFEYTGCVKGHISEENLKEMTWEKQVEKLMERIKK